MGTVPRRRSNDDGEETELEIRAPGGWAGKISGGTGLIIVLAMQAITTGVVYYGLERHEEEAKVRIAEAAKLVEDENIKRDMEARRRQAEILQNQVRILQTSSEALVELRIQTYVSTLTEQQRKELQLAVPPELISRRRQWNNVP